MIADADTQTLQTLTHTTTQRFSDNRKWINVVALTDVCACKIERSTELDIFHYACS